jgi:hypothetical protein
LNDFEDELTVDHEPANPEEDDGFRGAPLSDFSGRIATNKFGQAD